MLGKKTYEVTQARCYIGDCSKAFESEPELWEHTLRTHNARSMDKLFHCGYKQCDFKAKYEVELAEHRVEEHGVDVRWNHCSQTECHHR